MYWIALAFLLVIIEYFLCLIDVATGNGIGISYAVFEPGAWRIESSED